MSLSIIKWNSIIIGLNWICLNFVVNLHINQFFGFGLDWHVLVLVCTDWLICEWTKSLQIFGLEVPCEPLNKNGLIYYHFETVNHKQMDSSSTANLQKCVKLFPIKRCLLSASLPSFNPFENVDPTLNLLKVYLNILPLLYHLFIYVELEHCCFSSKT